MAAKNKRNAGPAALSAPRTEDPFFGTELKYVPVKTLSAGHEVVKYQVRGAGWASTKLFTTLEEAQWHFSHNGGAVPSFPNPYRRIERVDREERAPEQAEAESLVSKAGKFGEAVADVVAK